MNYFDFYSMPLTVRIDRVMVWKTFERLNSTTNPVSAAQQTYIRIIENLNLKSLGSFQQQTAGGSCTGSCEETIGHCETHKVEMPGLSWRKVTYISGTGGLVGSRSVFVLPLHELTQSSFHGSIGGHIRVLRGLLKILREKMQIITAQLTSICMIDYIYIYVYFFVEK